MKPDFTPAGWRVLAEAAHWTNCADEGPLDLPELLLGLLAEEECRAAAMLASKGIDASTVYQRWPNLRRIDASPAGRETDFSLSLQAAIAEARQRLAELPQPLALATEHLLLGAVAVESEVARWMVEQGLRATEIEALIFHWEGVTPGPLEIEAIQGPFTAMPQAGSDCALLRVIDATANRAREALRVIEDHARFVLDDAHLTTRFKQLRHELTAALQSFPTADLLASRDTLADVGTQISTPSEQTRADVTDIVTANFKRLQESLRSLEEYAKTFDDQAASRLEQARYQIYTLERAVAITAVSIARLSQSYLYVLIDGRASVQAFEEYASTLIAAGVHVLQLRDKQLGDRELLQRARRLRALTRNTRTLFIVNDRPDLAALSQADGVHVGQEELSLKDARTIIGPRCLIGVSTHSIEQARQAVLEGANYIGVGPTFPSHTKQFEAFPGLELLRAVSDEIRLPAFAIGGISRENLPQVLSTGATRIAVSAAISRSLDPAEAAKAFLSMLHSGQSANL